MKKSFTAMLFFLALGALPACQGQTTDGSIGGFDPAWISCSQDSDCAVGQSMCGFPRGYNRAAIEAVNKYNKSMGAMIACGETPEKPMLGMAFCKNSVCDVVLDK